VWLKTFTLFFIAATFYQEKWEDNLDDGLLTRCVTGYEEGGKHWFAAHQAK
jgi:hypothetical protein